MKKQLTAVLMIFALLLTMVGCSAANAVQMLDAAEDKVEAKLDAAEKKLEESLREAAAPAVPVETRPAPVETIPAVTEPAGKLTREQAEKIAFDYLGFTADQVTRLHSEYEIDDGIPQFDVEFHQGDWEYEFEIHAENGRILSYDKDHKYD
jgi:uncharacterized membrane protein YkoI